MLVGRDHVLRGVEAALGRAFAGEGRLVLLSGEAGIGKTSVTRAVAARAEADGAVVRWGACWEGQDSVPFSLWIDCLRRPGGDVCAAAASHLEEGGFEAVADGGGAARGRLRLHAAVVDAVAEAAGSRPQVVILDDLHWADAPSVELLVALAARLPAMPVLLVDTYRDDELQRSSPLMSIRGNGDRIALERRARRGPWRGPRPRAPRRRRCRPSPSTRGTSPARTGARPNPWRDRVAAAVVAEPETKRPAMALPVEGDRWLVLFGGLNGEKPPVQESERLAYARVPPVPR